jgi:hypothetical protein
MFRTGLQSYLIIATTRMKQSTFQQHKEVAMLCEEDINTTKTRSALSVPQNTKQATLAKTQSNIGKIDKHCTNCG